ncbi:ATP-binding protein [uncultured Flavobacterium sp.]|uniref:AAA family ATPase n=1 Tax=uncultured Flavobacterium sp. TaxID=165435 RepID=UPI0025F5C248|nr:ATP-binding protein [uncultured Flavobacterium sp.]
MVELSLVPSDLKNSVNVIKKTNPEATKNKDYYALTSAAIYGPNASGKSNVIRALREFMDYIISSTDNKPNDQILLFNPFKLNNVNVKMPSLFSIDMVIDNVLYTYSIEVARYEIIKESLSFFPKGISVKIFERKKQQFHKGNGYEGIFEVIKQRTNENQLFLGKAASENVEIIKKFYQKISSINIYTTELFHSHSFNQLFSNLVFKFSEKGTSLIKSLIKKLDTQVVDFEERGDVIKMFHLNAEMQKIEFDFEEESSGTQRLISFIPLVLLALRSGSVIVVDEFERSLHPEIAQYILGFFNDLEVNKYGAQFIFATHDVTLLSLENNLRRDQINLVEKNDKGETELYSVSDIKGIREGNFEKWYLEGRLGGLPNIAKETFRDELIDFINF